MTDEKDEGLPLALDASAESSNRALPAFLARPEGAPAYHGFPVLSDVVVDGFTLGLISDSLSSPSEWGDAFVIAPDGRRAGLVWETGGERYFNTYCSGVTTPSGNFTPVLWSGQYAPGPRLLSGLGPCSTWPPSHRVACG